MSSMCAPPLLKKRERLSPRGGWGEVLAQDLMTDEIRSRDVGQPSPISVENDKLLIKSALLETGRVYSFEYFGSQMALWKLPSGAVDLFEIVEE
jgi:hypothetical protein